MDDSEFIEFVQEHSDRFAGVHPESTSSLDHAESQLGYPLPSTLRWLLSTHGYSSPCGVDSLDEALSSTRRCRESISLPSHIFIVNDWGDGGVVYMDLRSGAVYWGDAADLHDFEGTIPDGTDVYPDYPAWVQYRLEVLDD